MIGGGHRNGAQELHYAICSSTHDVSLQNMGASDRLLSVLKYVLPSDMLWICVSEFIIPCRPPSCPFFGHHLYTRTCRALAPPRSGCRGSLKRKLILPYSLTKGFVQIVPLANMTPLPLLGRRMCDCACSSRNTDGSPFLPPLPPWLHILVIVEPRI